MRGVTDVDKAGQPIELHRGDRVALTDDDWDLVGHKLIVVDPEPVPGSFQCVIDADGEQLTVSRASLRPF
jgi:hypothetical protein